MGDILKGILKVLLGALIAFALVIGGYAAYMEITYYRIPDYEPIEAIVEPTEAISLSTGVEYSAISYNIGFGAYSPDYTFFMDTGIMEDGTRSQGTSGTAVSLDAVITNTEGAIDVTATVHDGSAPDFILLQEVDTDSDRSYHVNQVDRFIEAFPGYGAWFASNFHSAFLALPLYDMHGVVNAGLLTLSRADAASAIRRSYPLDESVPTKYFDLDRCFEVLTFNVEDGHRLILINTHMSAYDEGGIIRNQQLRLLLDYAAEQYAAGNYIVMGGDWNHALCGSEDMYPSHQLVPDWISVFSEDDLPEGFSVVRADNIEQVATCRGVDIPYEEGFTYRATVDGFIVSDNVDAHALNIETGYGYSDHNPVLIEFTLGA
ncbi:MAG: endonuclease [Atopobiaceae bacterium]|nr:endonuclease [Atopobiaceae bacterium]